MSAKVPYTKTCLAYMTQMFTMADAVFVVSIVVVTIYFNILKSV